MNKINDSDRIIFVNIKKSYEAFLNHDTKNQLYRPSVYDCTVKYWHVDDKKAHNATHIIGCYIICKVWRTLDNMATHKSYKCTNPKCSFCISWSEDGISPIMSGMRVPYQCPKCGNIEFDFFDGYGQPEN